MCTHLGPSPTISAVFESFLKLAGYAALVLALFGVSAGAAENAPNDFVYQLQKYRPASHREYEDRPRDHGLLPRRLRRRDVHPCGDSGSHTHRIAPAAPRPS